MRKLQVSEGDGNEAPSSHPRSTWRVPAMYLAPACGGGACTCLVPAVYRACTRDVPAPVPPPAVGARPTWRIAKASWRYLASSRLGGDRPLPDPLPPLAGRLPPDPAPITPLPPAGKRAALPCWTTWMISN